MIMEEAPTLAPLEARLVFGARCKSWAEEAASINRAGELEWQDAMDTIEDDSYRYC